MRLLPGLTIVVAALCLAAWPAAAEKRVALVIGNAAYKDAPLKNPVNDARAMAAKLKELGFQVVQRENTTKLEMERAVADFGDLLGPDTVGLVFYAGHGLQVDGRNYMVPVDARIATQTRVRLEAVDVDILLEQMGSAGSRVNIVILDACRNNPFERRFRAYEGGLAQINAPTGTLIAYATAPGKTAADGSGANGLYTAELVRALDAPGLAVEEVFKRVRVEVARASGGAQTPWEASSLTGSFAFRAAPRVAAPAPAPAAPAPVAAPTVDKETVFWTSIQSSDDPAMFDAYVRQFPNGTFVEIARAKAAALRQPKPAPAAPAQVATAPPVTSGDFQRNRPQAAAPPATATPAPTEGRVDIAALYTQREIKGTYVVTSKACGFNYKLASSKRIEFGATGTTPWDAHFSGDGMSGKVNIQKYSGGLRISIWARTGHTTTPAQVDGFAFDFFVNESDIAADGSFTGQSSVNSNRGSRCADYRIEFTAR
jgi:uncharacterized caspase-like protein